MKPLAIWAVAVIGAFAALAGVTSATRDTERVYVVVDTSFFMQDVIDRVPAELDRIDDRSYSEFALGTIGRNSESIHGYRSELDLGRVDVFGPCSLDEIASSPDAERADDKIFVTSTSLECPTDALDDWTIVELAP